VYRYVALPSFQQDCNILLLYPYQKLLIEVTKTKEDAWKQDDDVCNWAKKLTFRQILTYMCQCVNENELNKLFMYVYG